MTDQEKLEPIIEALRAAYVDKNQQFLCIVNNENNVKVLAGGSMIRLTCVVAGAMRESEEISNIFKTAVILA